MAELRGGVLYLNDHKAGLSDLDGNSKEEVSRILTEASMGSPFFENKKLKHQAIQQRIALKKKLLEEASAEEFSEALRKADQLLHDTEISRDLSRTIVHVDMDMFYAAVEVRDNPSLKDKPLGVGSNSMLSTSNYVARKFGVRAAQPGFMARKLCPDLIIVPCNFRKYRAVGEIVRGIFTDYDPKFSSHSLDEAYLDITDHLQSRQSSSGDSRTLWRCDCRFLKDKNPQWSPGFDESVVSTIPQEPQDLCLLCSRPAQKIVTEANAEGAVLELRTKVFQRTSLTCSAGIAPNTMLAKICTDKKKPNGQYRLSFTREAVLEFVKDLPVRKIPGVGAATEEMLRAFGIETCSDLFTFRAEVAIAFSELSLEHFMRISLGIGSTILENDEERKSISNERTFKELSKPGDLFKKLQELTDDLADLMQDRNICGKCVTLKIKLVTFESRTRAHTVPRLIRRGDEIFPVAKKILEQEIRLAGGHLKLRLMGVRMSQLQPMSATENHQQQSTLTKFLQMSPLKGIAPQLCVVRMKRSTTVLPQKNTSDQAEVVLSEEGPLPSRSSDVRPRCGIDAVCPNCSQSIHTDEDFVALNRHIDECLNKDLIRQTEAEFPAPPKLKKLRLTDPSFSPKAKTKTPTFKKITDYMTR